jgi:hypothetical protein
MSIKANDDVFDSEGKRPGKRVDMIPASVGTNLGYGVTPFQKVTAHYELHYDAYFRDQTTAPTFVIPPIPRRTPKASDTSTAVAAICFLWSRLHGVPSAVCFAELGMFRGSYSFNVFELSRLDVFVDHARGRDPQLGQPVTGTGVRLNVRTLGVPFSRWISAGASCQTPTTVRDPPCCRSWC